MGIYIKSIKKPSCCSVCPLEKAILEKDGSGIKDAYCRVTGGTTLSHMMSKRADCPLIEVKNPHGRLIDADQLLKDMRDLYADHSWNWNEIHFSLFDLEMNLMGRTVIGQEEKDD